jgi:dTDP-4-amino-4,6-dideoxygalactose transaminase
MAKFFHPGTLVILESTTYPGTTDELMLPMFERNPGNAVSNDLYLRAINLPTYHDLSNPEMDRVTHAIHSVF